MYRAVLTAAAAAVLVVAGALPAQAAPHSDKPGAPTAVAVTGTATDADVTWGLPRSGARVTGWTVSVTPAERHQNHGVDRLRASARSDHFSGLRTGTTYSFAVRAVGARGTGPAVTVKYKPVAPAPPAQSLFALDGSGSLVRFSTTGTGAPTTIAPNAAGYAANDEGDVFVPSADRTSIVMYPEGDPNPQTIATGLHLTPDLRTDVTGNLYWVDSVTGGVVKLARSGGAPTPWVSFGPVPNSGTTTLWAVGRDGTVSTWTSTPSAATVVTRSPAGATTTRTLDSGATGTFGYARALLADGHGGLYVDWSSPGGAGSFIWAALPAGATTWVSAEPRLAFEYGATNSSSFRLLQSKEWCTAPAEGLGQCAVDRTIPSLLVRALDGTTSSVPVTGLTAGSRGSNVGAADEAGDVFIDVDSGPSAGLWRVPAAGGTAQQLAAAQFTRLSVM